MGFLSWIEFVEGKNYRVNFLFRAVQNPRYLVWVGKTVVGSMVTVLFPPRRTVGTLVVG